jgi:hypothetical protein
MHINETGVMLCTLPWLIAVERRHPKSSYLEERMATVTASRLNTGVDRKVPEYEFCK